jgi:hypothetical protein
MDAPERGALMLVRFIAASIMGMSVLELSLYLVEFKFRKVPVNIFLSAIWCVCFLIGIVILIKSKVIAEWIANTLDE